MIERMEISTATAYIIGDAPRKQRRKQAKCRAKRWQWTYHMLLAAYKRHMGKKIAVRRDNSGQQKN